MVIEEKRMTKEGRRPQNVIVMDSLQNLENGLFNFSGDEDCCEKY